MTTKRYGLVGLCLLLAGLVVMAALGNFSSSASPSNPPYGTGQLAGATQSPAGDYGSYGGSSAAADANRPGGRLAVRPDAALGNVLTDSQGFTLYRFDKDTSKPPASNCADACAATWPPVLNFNASTTAGADVDQSKLGEIARADGTHQLTVGGWPAYRYAQDAVPGDTKGQGVGGTWFALAPDGTKAKAATDAPATPAPTTAAPTAPAPATTAAPSPAAAVPQKPQQTQVKVQISVIVHPQLGKIMVDGYGRTLYHFGKDTAWPMRSNCEGQCIKTWTPAPPVDANAISGVDPKLIGKMQRPDGTWQLSINCTPAYLYSGDQGYGSALGSGMDNNLWTAINPQGTPATGK
ncbi:SCO0930 family lipoprotein [Kitasatospora sp. NPDC003701]